MKMLVGLVLGLGMGAGALGAQEEADPRVEELKREFERALKRLQDQFERDKERLEREFRAAIERVRGGRPKPPEKEDGKGKPRLEELVERLARRVERLEERLERMGPPRRPFDFRGFEDFRPYRDWERWLHPRVREFLERCPRHEGKRFEFEFRKAPPRGKQERSPRREESEKQESKSREREGKGSF